MYPLDPARLPKGAGTDEVLGAFLDYLTSTGVEPYAHQEEAVLELFQGRNVVLDTPTGSGKTLVALAMQWRSLCAGRRSYYTVPIKALANEKFLSLCRIFGPDRVGMITGDATVNAEAPVICCTAEILANLALREGVWAPVDDVIMDEFHFYADAERGSAWQIPLLTLGWAQFLLMSATLGDPAFFIRELTRLTGEETVWVRSDDRPVPLEFSYSEEPLQDQVVALVEAGKAPVYLVHFTQNACAETARDLMSVNVCGRDGKAEIAKALEGADFRSPYGRELSRLLRHGIGIHHAGLLPKYRLLVEKLAGRGLLKVICGTDTLGVGVNVPIRTVLLTALCKYDGRSTRILSAREFRQVCGRAGRRGFDTVGHVVVQAPEHVIENLRLERKAAAGGKRKQVVKRKPPERGYVHWDEATFERLKVALPEALKSSFAVAPHTLLNVLSRPHEDGCQALRGLIRDCHEPAAAKRALRRRAFELFRGLLGARVLHIVPVAARSGPAKVAVDVSLPEDFSIHHALGLWLLDALPQLDAGAADYALNVVSLVESVVEDPELILRKQMDRAKGELIAQLKDEGVGYDERMEMLQEVEWPKPGKEFIYHSFNAFRIRHPYLRQETVRPKSVAREMLENMVSFEDYIKTYQLHRAEAVLLRHLNEVYKVLAQTVPSWAKNDAVDDAEAFLEWIVRRTDASMLEEWQRIGAGGGKLAGLEALQSKFGGGAAHPEAVVKAPESVGLPFTRQRALLTRQVRHLLMTLVTALGRGQWETALGLLEPDDPAGVPWSEQRLAAAMDRYLAGRGMVRLDPEARSAKHTRIAEMSAHAGAGGLAVTQTLVDPEDCNDWALHLVLDTAKSDETRTPVMRLAAIAVDF